MSVSGTSSQGRGGLGVFLSAGTKSAFRLAMTDAPLTVVPWFGRVSFFYRTQAGATTRRSKVKNRNSRAEGFDTKRTRPTSRQTNPRTDRPVDRPTDPTTDQTTDRTTDQLTDRSTDRPSDQRTNQPTHLVYLQVFPVEEHGCHVVLAERAALVHSAALAPCAGLAKVGQLHYLITTATHGAKKRNKTAGG